MRKIRLAVGNILMTHDNEITRGSPTDGLDFVRPDRAECEAPKVFLAELKELALVANHQDVTIRGPKWSRGFIRRNGIADYRRHLPRIRCTKEMNALILRG
jgi:hypothetical protein